ncbi:short palate, lung and nasal epithelium carcinoma-associated protein 2A-like [Dama dama]
MFQLWKLVLLCGLLAGTSASLLDNIRKDVLRKLKSGLEEGFNNLDSTLETIFQQLKTDFTLPQESNTEEADNTEETKNLLEQLISGIFQVVYRLTGVKISDLHILDLTLEATSDSSAEVKIPITAHVSVKLPVFGEIVDLGLNLVLQFSVSVETDQETGVSQVVVQECKNDQQSIELTVLGRRIGVLRQVVEFAINLANEVLSLVTQNELCPEVSSLLESLDAEYVKNRIDATSENSANVKISITADITVKLTLLGEIVHLDLNLVLKFSVRAENDTETGVSKVVMEE